MEVKTAVGVVDTRLTPGELSTVKDLCTEFGQDIRTELTRILTTGDRFACGWLLEGRREREAIQRHKRAPGRRERMLKELRRGTFSTLGRACAVLFCAGAARA